MARSGQALSLLGAAVAVPRCLSRHASPFPISHPLPLPPADIEAKFAKSAWGQKLAKRMAKAATTDFDRYKAAAAKMTRSAKVRRTFNGLKKAALKK